MNKSEQAGMTFCNTDAGLIAGSTTTLTMGVNPYYCIRGKAYTQATVTNVQPSIIDLTTGVTMAGIAAGFGAAILIGATSSESTTLRMIQGEAKPLLANTAAFTPGAFRDAPQFGPMPDDFCPYGYVIVKVATDYTSGSSYIFGSSNTTATGAQSGASTAHANTFTSIMVLPDRPQTS
ncbi:hypothetical protein KAR91_33680 [Candidatus Pacearchaeota archaeon]|nr:hypothetical protein [Candidatus Pacearchaeota archaeon]